MDEVQTAKAPWHFWLIATVSLLWNCIGPIDYVMSRMRNDEWIRMTMPTVNPSDMWAWIDAFPIYAQFGWGLGVWSGLAGSVLLLLRSRWAVPAFALSLVGAVLGLGYQIVAAPPLAGAEDMMFKIMPFIIIVIAVALFFYARAQQQKGVLR